MLKKLLKYDFKLILQSMLPVYGISLALAIVSNIFLRINKLTPLFRIPSAFITGLSIMLCIGIVFITFIIGMVNFYKQTVKDEGYLLHTLPVSKNSIIISKVTSVTVTSILSIIVAVLAAIITLNIAPNDVIEVIKTFIKGLQNYTLPVTLVIIAVFLGQIVNTLLMYTSISFGQKHATNKLLYSIIYGVVIYNVTQIISALIYVPLISNEKIMNALEQEIPPADILNIMMIITIAISLITITIYYLLTKRNLEKKLNLE